jgi:tRNA1Val (adenine37-N6)-methyltransferase
MNSLTTDTFFNGKLHITQVASGYRFSIDAIVLAHHTDLHSGDRLLDLGTGCGIIPLILAYRNPGIRVYGIEIQDELADLAASNVSANHMQKRITVLCRDMRDLKPHMIGGPADVIVCNPPYRKPNSGRLNPHPQRAVARHEIKVSLIDVLRTARCMLRTAGRFVTVYTAERSAELLSKMHSGGIEPKFLRAIHSHIDAAAKLILVVGIKGAQPGIKIGPPLIIYNADGQYTAEIQKMFTPEDD